MVFHCVCSFRDSLITSPLHKCESSLPSIIRQDIFFCLLNNFFLKILFWCHVLWLTSKEEFVFMKIPNIGNVMNKFEILGVVGEGKLEFHLWTLEHYIILSVTKSYLDSVNLAYQFRCAPMCTVIKIKLFFNYLGLILQVKTSNS